MPQARRGGSTSVPRMGRQEPSRETAPTDATVETVEAVQAVVRAALDAGHQILDAIEHALDDPAVARKLADIVAGLASLSQGIQDVATPSGRRPGPAGPTDVEHIEIS
jgi:hypothetical protein